MITKGIIINKVKDSNSYMVRIPLFETAGDSVHFVLEAPVCTNPGTYDAYDKGDVVYVAFEDDSRARPVIVGSLYLGLDKDVYKGGQKIQVLDVKDSASLPDRTSIGNISCEELIKLFRVGNNLKDFIKTLQQNLFDVLYYIGKVEYSSKQLGEDYYPDMIKKVFGKTTKWSETQVGDVWKYERLDD